RRQKAEGRRQTERRKEGRSQKEGRKNNCQLSTVNCQLFDGALHIQTQSRGTEVVFFRSIS
ncbi:MAG: hypothetical protein HC942_09615, partial [Microcoleus sp. SU_5_6]|nr:hypothetical protein [Microcoleus sp. SU_5_6]